MLIYVIKLPKTFAELQKREMKTQKIVALQYKLILFPSSLMSFMFYCYIQGIKDIKDIHKDSHLLVLQFPH